MRRVSVALAGAAVLAAVLAAVVSASAFAHEHEPPGGVRIAQAATKPAEASLEVRFWNSIRDGKDAGDFRTYLDAYPDGKFAAEARERLRQIEGGARAPKPAPAVPTTTQSKPAPVQAQVDGQVGAQLAQDCPECPKLALVPAGSFAMGSTEKFAFEQPVHEVTIRHPFYLGQTEVTYDEWDACVAQKGCGFSPNDRGAGRGRRPVANLNWTDTQEYLAWLSRKTGKRYRLPTESEWEYAARAGTRTTYPWGHEMKAGHANCSGCNGKPGANAEPVASYAANAFGLYDMLGNAAEWVEDCWSDSYRGAPADGAARSQPRCQERVLRGGSFNNDPVYLRSAARFKYDFDVRYYTNGFRVARDP